MSNPTFSIEIPNCRQNIYSVEATVVRNQIPFVYPAVLFSATHSDSARVQFCEHYNLPHNLNEVIVRQNFSL